MIMNVCHKDNLKVKCLSKPTSDSSIYIYKHNKFQRAGNCISDNKTPTDLNGYAVSTGVFKILH